MYLLDYFYGISIVLVFYVYVCFQICFYCNIIIIASNSGWLLNFHMRKCISGFLVRGILICFALYPTSVLFCYRQFFLASDGMVWLHFLSIHQGFPIHAVMLSFIVTFPVIWLVFCCLILCDFVVRHVLWVVTCYFICLLAFHLYQCLVVNLCIFQSLSITFFHSQSLIPFIFLLRMLSYRVPNGLWRLVKIHGSLMYFIILLCTFIAWLEKGWSNSLRFLFPSWTFVDFWTTFLFL